MFIVNCVANISSSALPRAGFITGSIEVITSCCGLVIPAAAIPEDIPDARPPGTCVCNMSAIVGVWDLRARDLRFFLPGGKES